MVDLQIVIRICKLHFIVYYYLIGKNNKISTNVWFSNDLTINYETLLEYYSLRFQTEYCPIKFHFRDANRSGEPQHFGLADFKNYKEKNLTGLHSANFVNLSFTMCLVSKIILEKYRIESKNPKASILDLKIMYNAQFTAKKIIKYLGIDDRNNF